MNRSATIPTFLAAAALCAAGCIQIETTVRLSEDGSATLTERLRISKDILDFGTTDGPLRNIAWALTRDAVLERVKQMGKGAELVRHETRDAENGARESIAVIRTPDFRELRYVSPYLASLEYPKHNVLVFNLTPLYAGEYCNRERVHPGHLRVTFTPATQERPKPLPKDYVPPKPPSPAQLQTLRDLQPMFRDLMKDIQLKLTFESYAPLERYYGFRGHQTLPKSYDLIDFSDKSLDRFGGDFLCNEEILLELLQLRVSGDNVLASVAGAVSNPTVPLYHPRSTLPIYFAPSRQLFDTHFKGRELDFGDRWGGKRTADFDEIGYKPDTRTPDR